MKFTLKSPFSDKFLDLLRKETTTIYISRVLLYVKLLLVGMYSLKVFIVFKVKFHSSLLTISNVKLTFT